MNKVKLILLYALHYLRSSININVIVAIIMIFQMIILTHLVKYSNLNYAEYQNILIISCFFLTIFSTIFGFFGVCAIIMVISFKSSTHQIEYVPIDSGDLKREETTNWKKLEEELSFPEKKFEEDFFPEFDPEKV